jgi:hypothetical protein
MARSVTINEVPVSVGNKKLRDSTAIFNMNPASVCPSAALGMCLCSDKCYARKAERLYKAVLPFRERQQKAFITRSADEIASAVIASGTKSKPIKEFRFSESGDFANQKAVDKMTAICAILKESDIACYGYTARKDLDFKELMAVATVQGSSFMVTNNFKYIPKGETIEGCDKVCAGDCRICSLCWTVKGLVIAIPQH